MKYRRNKKNKKKPSQAAKDNIGYIHTIQRKLLDAINGMLTQRMPEEPEERKRVLEEQERILGPKNSIAGVLGDVADTELKIEKQRPPVAPPPTENLDDKDIAVVRHYLERQNQE